MTINGLGRWRMHLTLDEFRRRGGDLAVGASTAVVPFAFDACVQALDRYRTMPFAEVAPRLSIWRKRDSPSNSGSQHQGVSALFGRE
jgi:hypothetical protein